MTSTGTDDTEAAPLEADIDGVAATPDDVGCSACLVVVASSTGRTG